ncbi:hypothetical protein [Cryptosporangium sp. NPDC048952]|uniref:hypothetical protein n=1 Tax=Cryptosporangium sp. NPDC048952 TaxID=3363961 RepID=UPI00371F0EB2
MPVAVQCVPLSQLPGARATSMSWTHVSGREDRIVRDLMDVPAEYRSRYAVGESKGRAITVPLPDAEAEKWLAAAQELIESVQAIAQVADGSNEKLRAPWRPAWRRTWWLFRFRVLGRRKVLRAEYEALWDGLHVELLDAFRRYAERTVGLEAHVAAAIERRDRHALFDRIKKRLEERIAFLRRSEALGRALEPGAPVWSCSVRSSRQGRYFEIWLPSLEAYSRDALLANVTAVAVQDALDAERSENPDTIVYWCLETMTAMRERHDDDRHGEELTWEELTGRRITKHPRGPRPSSPSRPSYGGPSSTYGADFGGGFSGDAGGGFGGGFSGGGFGGI